MLPEIIIAILVITILAVIGYASFHQKKKSEEIKQSTIELLKQYGEFSHEHKQNLFKINDKTYQILFFYVPTNAELTINSKKIWEVRDASKSNLIDQTHFLKSNQTKIVVVYPTTVKIKRYINENELEFVSYKRPFYEMYVVRHFELIELLKENIL
jgi:Tfp pilus assembly protein PilE